jgi:S1-C subfamily serine protease
MEKENFDFSSEQIEKWLDACSQSRDRNKYFEVLGKHSEKINLLRPDLEHLNEYLKNVSNSIVLISIYQEEQIGFGTGFAISENQIITNKHVVQGCSQNQIHLVTSNNKLRVTEIICDNRDDVALLAVESETPLPFLRLGKSQFVEPGESIIAIGFPYVENISHQENLYITKGTVSSIRPTTFCSERVFYLDAQIGRGMSGGPVINEYGEVIGVVTFTLKEVVTLESLHFAIPVQLIKNILSYKEI